MEVIYRSVAKEIDAAIEKAEKAGRTIEKIKLRPAEMRELKAETMSLAQLLTYAVNRDALFYNNVLIEEIK